MPIGAILGLLGTGLAVGGSAASNWMSNQSNLQAVRETNEANMQINQRQLWHADDAATTAFNRQKQLYNSYFSPEAMVRQYDAAGLSTGLMYGMGGNGGSMSSVNQAVTPSMLGMEAAQFNPIMNEQVANIAANTAKTLAETEKLKTESAKNEGELGVQAETIKLLQNEQDKIKQDIAESQKQVEVMVAEIAKKNAETGNVEANTALTRTMEDYKKAETDLLNIDLTTRGAINEATLREIDENIKKYKAEQSKMYAEAKKAKVDASILEKSSEYIINNYRNQMYKSGLEAKYLVPAQVEKLKKETDLEKAKAELKKMKEDFIKKHGFNKDYNTWWEAMKQAMIDGPTLLFTKWSNFD